MQKNAKRSVKAEIFDPDGMYINFKKPMVMDCDRTKNRGINCF